MWVLRTFAMDPRPFLNSENSRPDLGAVVNIFPHRIYVFYMVSGERVMYPTSCWSAWSEPPNIWGYNPWPPNPHFTLIPFELQIRNVVDCSKTWLLADLDTRLYSFPVCRIVTSLEISSPLCRTTPATRVRLSVPRASPLPRPRI